jgi:hypothetical protein
MLRMIENEVFDFAQSQREGFQDAYSTNALKELVFGEGTVIAQLSEETFKGATISAIEVPQSLEVIGKVCFTNVISFETIGVGQPSRMRRIDTKAFAGTK